MVQLSFAATEPAGIPPEPISPAFQSRQAEKHILPTLFRSATAFRSTHTHAGPAGACDLSGLGPKGN